MARKDIDYAKYVNMEVDSIYYLLDSKHIERMLTPEARASCKMEWLLDEIEIMIDAKLGNR